MGHNLKKTSETFRPSPTKWLAVGSQIGDLANEWADRTDLVATVSETAGHGAPAAFAWWTAEIELNTTVAFGEGVDPQFIPDLRTRTNQYDYPQAIGAVFHEAGHARYTRYNREALAEEATPTQHALVKAFEESRTENFMLKKFPKNKSFLRSCVFDLVVEDMLDSDRDYMANGIIAFSHMILLTVARLDVGTLKKRDIGIINDAYKKLFDKDAQKKLRSIWKSAQDHSDHSNYGPLLDLAKEWEEVLRENDMDPENENPEDLPDWLKDLMKEMLGDPKDGESGEGSSEDGESDEGGESSPGSGSGRPSLKDMAADTAADAQGDVNQDAIQEVMNAAAEARAEAAAEANEHKDTASQVYGRGTGPGPAYTSSTLSKERPPTSDERRAAVALSKQLEKAKYRDRTVTRTTSEIPPGRMNSRQMVSRAEQIGRGGSVTAQPFAQKKRRHTDEPELTIGALVDISGSMGAAMEPMASMSWILSEATKRVQGNCSMVYYGNDVFPVLKPGQHFDKVKVYTAPDGTERFDKAFKALDGTLNLLNGDGARLLVIVSDLYYMGSEMAATKKWMQRCRDAGVAVIVIPFGYDDTAKRNIAGIKGVELVGEAKTRTMVGAAMEVGAAAVRQLQIVSASR